MTIRAQVQLASGIDEDVTNVRVTHSRDGKTCTATFCFDQPHFMSEGAKDSPITGIRLIDEEGELLSRRVQASFQQGEFLNVKALFEMTTQAECERFTRFMNRYAAENNMEFQPANTNPTET